MAKQDAAPIATHMSEQGFWSRQFHQEQTWYQFAFDILAGVVAPPLCLIFDPIVFSDTDLNRYQAAGYSAIGLEVLALWIWLFLGEFAGRSIAFLGGMLLFGAFLAGTIGILLLPLSLIGLLVLIGVLGFLPFCTAFAFLRNGFMALRQANARMGKTMLSGLLATGVIFAASIPMFVHHYVSHNISDSIIAILGDDPEAADRAVTTLCRMGNIMPSQTKVQTRIALGTIIRQGTNFQLRLSADSVERLRRTTWFVNDCKSVFWRFYNNAESDTRRQSLNELQRQLLGTDITYYSGPD
jgi:hypothetical protein